MKKRGWARWGAIAWVLPALLLLGTFVYVPLAQNLYFSVHDWNIFTDTFTFVGGEHYADMVADPIFWRALGNNIAYAVISVIVQVFGSMCLAAMVESVRRGWLRNLLRTLYFIPSAISMTVAGLLFYFVYEPKIGILNAILAMGGLDELTRAWLGDPTTAMWAIIAMSQWQGFGYTTLLFAVAIQRIPGELYDAAAIDGIGGVRRFWHVTMPLVREMTTLMIIITVSGAFQVFNEVMVMTSGGPNNATQVLATWLYRSGFVRNNFGYAAAIATALFVITLVLGVAQLIVSHRRRVQW